MWRRLGLWSNGLLHMIFSTDARYKPLKQPNPELVVQSLSNDLSERPPTRRIIFIRHGESCWNEVFNRGFGPSMLVRLTKSIIGELMCSFGEVIISVSVSASVSVSVSVRVEVSGVHAL